MSYTIKIRLSAKRLTLLKNNTVFRSYPIAIGKSSTPTPTGSYSIINKAPNPGGVFGAYWLAFRPHYGIHGTNNPSSIGKAITNGCIRMHNQHIRELARYVNVGAPVRISY